MEILVLLVFALFVLLIFGVVAIVLIRIGLKRNANMKVRTAELKAVAAAAGFEFAETAGLSTLPVFLDVETFEGTPTFLENLMTGSIGGDRVAVFDLVYTNISAGTTGTVSSRQTMCLIESSRLRLPRFYVRPEGILEKALHFAGRNDIDFPEFPAFSDGFLLFGENEAAIRSVFGPDLIRHFEQNSVLAACASGSRLMVFRSRYVARPNEINGYVSATLATAAMLSKAGAG